MNRLSSLRTDQSGQAMTEFAIAFPVLLLLVLAIIQLALIYHARQVVNYAAFSAARSLMVHPRQQEKALDAAVLSCTPISGKLSMLAESVSPALGNLPAAGDFSEISDTGGMAANIVDKYYYSEFFTGISVLDAMGEPVTQRNALIVGDQFSVEVTHRYLLIIPIINRIIAFRRHGIAGKEIEIAEDSRSYLGKGFYFYPLRAHVTMRVEDDKE